MKTIFIDSTLIDELYDNKKSKSYYKTLKNIVIIDSESLEKDKL